MAVLCCPRGKVHRGTISCFSYLSQGSFTKHIKPHLLTQALCDKPWIKMAYFTKLYVERAVVWSERTKKKNHYTLNKTALFKTKVAKLKLLVLFLSRFHSLLTCVCGVQGVHCY